MKTEIHIFATEPDEGVEWNHNDWFYELRQLVNQKFKPIGKKYKSRSAAARAANKIGKAIHWYNI